MGKWELFLRSVGGDEAEGGGRKSRGEEVWG